MEISSEERNAFKCLIKNINWFIGARKLAFTDEKFTAWSVKYDTEFEKIKGVLTDFKATTLEKSLEVYFKYLVEKNLALDNVERTFISNFDNVETFMVNEIFENLRERIKPRDEAITDITSKFGKINLNVTINIESMDGNEEDLEDWFESFERISGSNGWTNDIRSIKLPCYLKETALLLWQSMSNMDKNDYTKCKEIILERFKKDESYEQLFFERKQKEFESVTEYSLKLEKLAKQAFGSADKDKEILRTFWKGLKLSIKGSVLSANPNNLKEAVEITRKVERFLAENEKEIQVNSAQESESLKIEAIGTNRDSRFKKRDYRERSSRYSPASSSDRSSDRKNNNSYNYNIDRNNSNSYNYKNDSDRKNNYSYNYQGKEGRSKTPLRHRNVCLNCGLEGHLARQCQKKQGLTCYNCNKPGHIAKNCYSKN